MLKKIAGFITGLLLVALFVGVTLNTVNSKHPDYSCVSSPIPDDDGLDDVEVYKLNPDLES